MKKYREELPRFSSGQKTGSGTSSDTGSDTSSDTGSDTGSVASRATSKLTNICFIKTDTLYIGTTYIKCVRFYEIDFRSTCE